MQDTCTQDTSTTEAQRHRENRAKASLKTAPMILPVLQYNP